MNGVNRFLIFLLLLALLYALYRYQQQIDNTDDKVQKAVHKKKNDKNLKQIKNSEYLRNNLIDEDSIDRISIDNVSQLSLGSYEDMKSLNGPYKQDSILDSLDSKETINFLDDNSRYSMESVESNFFFQK